jgi:hypothetical protein
MILSGLLTDTSLWESMNVTGDGYNQVINYGIHLRKCAHQRLFFVKKKRRMALDQI